MKTKEGEGEREAREGRRDGGGKRKKRCNKKEWPSNQRIWGGPDFL